MFRHALLILSVPTLMAVAGPSGIAQTPVTRPPARSIWDGVYTDAQAPRGEALYLHHCGRCHGADLAGLPGEPLRQAMPEVEGLAQRMLGEFDRTPELTGPTFYGNYDRLLLSDLVERIRISMPTGKPGILNRKDTVAVVAYLLFYGGFPLGRTELTDRLEGLQEIQIAVYRK